MPIISVKGLRQSYGEQVVLRDVRLDVEAGEIVGVVGPNGAGKTTTVECIGGLRRPDAGSIEVDGLDPATSPAPLTAPVPRAPSPGWVRAPSTTARGSTGGRRADT